MASNQEAGYKVGETKGRAEVIFSPSTIRNFNAALGYH